MDSSQQGPRKEKEQRKKNFVKKIGNGNEQARNSSFTKRKPTLMKKAMELKTLCGVDVCVICYNPSTGEVDSFPENQTEVSNLCQWYLRLDEKDKKEWNYLDFYEAKEKKLLKKREKALDGLISNLSNWLDGLSGNSLTSSVNILETKVKSLKERIQFLMLNEEVKAKTTDHDQLLWDNDNNKNATNCYGNIYSSFMGTSSCPNLGGNSIENPMNEYFDLDTNNEFDLDFPQIDNIIKGNDREGNLEMMRMDGENHNSNSYVGLTSDDNICHAVPMSVWKPAD